MVETECPCPCPASVSEASAAARSTARPCAATVTGLISLHVQLHSAQGIHRLWTVSKLSGRHEALDSSAVDASST